MSILTCARRHRSLLSRAQRAASRRHSARAKRGAPRASAAVSAAPRALGAPQTQTQAQIQPLAVVRASSSLSHASTAAMDASGERAPDAAERVPETSWSAMLIALFAMIQPEWAKEKPLAEDVLDDLRVKSVPPHVSDVIVSADTEVFWRYDMDSYAANRHNEDRSQYVVDAIANAQTGIATPTFFCACYDGHGGEEAVDFVQKNLYNNIRRHLTTGDETISHSIISGFKDTDEEFMRRSQQQFERGAWASCSVGACAVLALVVDKTLYVASCGDCRAIMGYRDRDGTLRVEQITSDHSANEEREQRRLRVLYPEDYDIVREIGRKNFYVKGRLQPTRSIGDTYMKVKEVNRAPMPRGLRISGSFKRPYISSVPDVFRIDLRDRHPEFLVLGSDGLFGEISNDEIVRLVSRFRKEGVTNVSAALREAVMDKIAAIYGISAAEMEDISPGDRRNYHDDITIDVLHFAPPDVASPHAAAA